METLRRTLHAPAMLLLVLAAVAVVLAGCTPRFHPYSHPPLEDMPRP